MRKGIALLLILVITTLNITLVNSASSSAVSEDTWVSRAPMPTARGILGVAAVNGKIYAIGGDGKGTNEMYDPATDTWTTKTSMLTPRDNFGIVVYQNKIYCIGGTRYGNACATNEVYDPATDSWETKTPMPIARWEIEVNAAHGKVYVMGGYPNRTLNQAYDPVLDCWVEKAPIPNIITEGGAVVAVSAASAVVDNSIYWMGMTGFTDWEGHPLNQMYNPENDSWSQRACIAISPFVAAATTGEFALKRIYFLGSDNMWAAYDPVNNNWTICTTKPNLRDSPGIAVVNDTIYMVGGRYLFSKSAENDQYIPLGYGTPDPTYQSPMPSPTPIQSPFPSPSHSLPPILNLTLSPSPLASQQFALSNSKPVILPPELPYAIAITAVTLLIMVLVLKINRKSKKDNNPPAALYEQRHNL